MTHEEAAAEENHLPIYAVRLTGAVREQTRAAFFWINDNAGIDAADTWQNGLESVWSSLATLPSRCPVADEDRFYQKKHPGPPLRVFLYRQGRSTWQILFTIQSGRRRPGLCQAASASERRPKAPDEVAGGMTAKTGSDWYRFDDGATLGQAGSEGGLVLRDEEHPLGARITLEQECEREYDAMKIGLVTVAESGGRDFNAEASAFVEQFP